MTFPRCVCPFPAFSYVWWTCISKETQWNHTWAAWGCLMGKDRAALRFPETKLWSQFGILWFQFKFCIPASWALWLPWGESRAPGWGVMNRGLIDPLGDVSPTSSNAGAAVGERQLSCNGHLHPCRVLVVHESFLFFFFLSPLFCCFPAPP